MWRLSILEFLITLILCLAIFGLLWGYHSRSTLSVTQKRVFNALVTGLSVALGINLSSSLKSYAKMMRWRLLATGYRPLSQFELIMGCDQQLNVLKLLFTARGGRYPFIPTKTQLFCLLWIAVNLAATILVACIGLTYSLDQSTTTVLTISGGITSVAVLSPIASTSENSTHSTYYTQLTAANQFGIGGQAFGVEPSLDHEDAVGLNWIYEDPDPNVYGHYLYWFVDENSESNDLDEADISDRSVDATATCRAFPVIEGGYGNLSYIIYNDNGRHVRENIDSQGQAGAMTYISETKSKCGARCTQVKAFQAIYEGDDGDDDSLDYVDTSQFFLCNNTVGLVQNVPDTDSSSYEIPDLQAKILAGAIGWTGNPIENDTQEYQLYPRGSPQSPDSSAVVEGIEDIIAAFSMQAVADMDSEGPRQDVTGDEPIYADYLHILHDWKEAGPLLAVIPALHFLTMMAVIIWANKAIIKDDSCLATAKLLRPIVGQLGEHGCMLRGEHIIQELGDPMVLYGFQEMPSRLKHVDVFELGSGTKLERSFAEGDYDGAGPDSGKRERCKKVKTD